MIHFCPRNHQGLLQLEIGIVLNSSLEPQFEDFGRPYGWLYELRQLPVTGQERDSSNNMFTSSDY